MEKLSYTSVVHVYNSKHRGIDYLESLNVASLHNCLMNHCIQSQSKFNQQPRKSVFIAVFSYKFQIMFL